MTHFYCNFFLPLQFRGNCCFQNISQNVTDELLHNCQSCVKLLFLCFRKVICDLSHDIVSRPFINDKKHDMYFRNAGINNMFFFMLIKSYMFKHFSGFPTHPGHISWPELYRPKEAENHRDDVDEVCQYWSPLVSEEIKYLSFQDADLETKQKKKTEK